MWPFKKKEEKKNTVARSSDNSVDMTPIILASATSSHSIDSTPSHDCGSSFDSGSSFDAGSCSDGGGSF